MLICILWQTAMPITMFIPKILAQILIEALSLQDLVVHQEGTPMKVEVAPLSRTSSRVTSLASLAMARILATMEDILLIICLTPGFSKFLKFFN